MPLPAAPKVAGTRDFGDHHMLWGWCRHENERDTNGEWLNENKEDVFSDPQTGAALLRRMRRHEDAGHLNFLFWDQTKSDKGSVAMQP